MRSQNSTMLEDWEAFVLLIRKMDNVKGRVIRGGEECGETIEIARRKLEVPMEAAMPCKRGNRRVVNPTRIKKTKHVCIVEARESTRQRLESSPPKDHEDHIAGKGYNSTEHYNLVHKFIHMPQAMKIPDAKAAVVNEWNKLQKIPAWQLDKVKSKKRRLFWKHKETTRKSTLLHWWTSAISKNAELVPKIWSLLKARLRYKWPQQK